MDHHFEEYSIHANSNPYFKIAVDFICSEFTTEEIIETGTYNGLGSTKVLCEIAKEYRIAVKSIECHEENVHTARFNLRKFDNVEVIHGLSIDREDAIDWMTHNLKMPPVEVSMDYDLPPEMEHITDNQYLKLLFASYAQEISEPCPRENVLEELINNRINQLIFLDSAGGIGFYEFQKCIMSLPPKVLACKVLMVDDVNKIKHYQTVKSLEQDGFCVNYDGEGRMAWCKF
jgi:hypothetical protein